MEHGARARVANSERIHLNRLVRNGGECSIRFEAFSGVSFALHAQLVGETDAHADGVTVVLDNPPNSANKMTAPEARSSAFGKDKTAPVAHLLSVEPPSMGLPVSQPATDAQTEEECFEAWVSRLGLQSARPLEQWASAFLMQTLNTYGMLAKDAQLLALGGLRATQQVAAALAEKGAYICLASRGDHEGAELPPIDPPLATIDAPLSEGGITHRHYHPDALPGDLFNFDALWSDGLVDRAGTVEQATAAIEAAMQCLRPGGIAIHILPFTEFGDDRQDTQISGFVFQRVHIERLALILISRNFEVGRIKVAAPDIICFDPEDKSGPLGRFAVIARRPPSAF